ncbi:PAS domain S-box-containing protein/diguanylate cyclase (GGDEF) domain-containing protein [Thiocapsa roseopersicina]|uniref:PAS domain S-box-containing protein/diguanylate cyclase (GGDEF) domain-containing protein n=1 Tax=Thiocapsa roseopersicina TaxID=1058 RepID=A0A1H2XX12_THIRO|nr:PAS domain S-box-containing protein/diguanylate cyclase (GGDEF) domain-containing protein [Thiocapsa roseopersicina]
MDMRPKPTIASPPSTRWGWLPLLWIPTLVTAAEPAVSWSASVGAGTAGTLALLAAVAAGAAWRERRLRHDIAAQAQAAHAGLEDRLARSERLVEETQQLGHLGTWEWDAENDRLEWSAEVYRIFGVPPESFPGTYKGFLDFVHPEDRTRVEHAVRAAIAGIRDYDCEHRILLPDGQVRYLHERATLTRKHGRPVSMTGTVRDVTETRRAWMLQESRIRIMELIADGAPVQEALDAIAASIEALDQSLMCSIMLMDNATHRLRVGTAPSLPDRLVEAIDRLTDEPPNGAAPYPIGESLVVADVLYHPYWQSLAGITEETGVRAFWSEPIRDAGGDILGAFDIYSRTPGKPDAEQLIYIAQGAALVAVALQQARDRAARIAAEERARLLLESTGEGVFGLDPEGVTTFINPTGARLLGYDPNDLVGKPCPAVTHDDPEEGDRDATACRMLSVMHTGKDIVVSDEVLQRRDGTAFPVEYRATPIRVGDSAMGVVVTFHDITERKRSEEQILRLAYYDSLTGLPNRALFKSQLAKRLTSVRRADKGFALHFLDLDRFKEVNDTLGHPVGDLLLKEVAQRLSALVRGMDTIARFGGDEFAVIQPDAQSISDAATLAAKIVEHLARPYSIDGHAINCGASVGVVFVPKPDIDLETLLGRADVALYKAKNNGRGSYAFHTDAMTRQVRRDAALTDRIDKAVRSGELFLHYQPQVELASGRITAVEALVRWQHPVEGLLPPGDFVHLAERRGLFHILGSWVLSTAAREAQGWHDRGLAFGRVSINVSPQQVRAGCLADDVLATAQETGLDPARLELELTETAMMEYGEHYRTQIAVLRDLGVRLVLDDFGTGFSSLTYLRRSAVSTLKIDRQFVRELDDNPEAVETVQALLAVAHALKLDTVAEGVETRKQAERLAAMGCRCGQGIWFAPPMEAKAIERHLAAGFIRPGSEAAESDNDRLPT